MNTASNPPTYQFARRGHEWFLKREGAADPTEIYLNMSRDRALIHAEDRLKSSGGLLRIHDEDGCMTEERPYQRPVRRIVLAA